MVRLASAQQPQASSRPPCQSRPVFGLGFWRGLSALAPPDPLDPLVIDDPARCRSQQLRDLPIAIAAILPSQFDDVGGQPLLVVWPRRNAALRGSMCCPSIAGRPAVRTALQLGSNMQSMQARRREGLSSFLGQPLAKIILSSVRSDTARRSRAFSASRFFSLFT